MSLDVQSRENHKKAQRLQNSLGSILSGIGKGEVSVNTTPVSSAPAPSSSKATNGSDQQRTASTSGSRPWSYDAQNSKEMDNWNDLKGNNDDLDPEWLESEHRELDELFGYGIVTVKYTDQNVLGYYCELCFATMNAMKSLEMHCSGMKHLKKKDIYEKNKASGEGIVLGRKKNTEKSKHPVVRNYNQNHYLRSEPISYPVSERNPYSKESRSSWDGRSSYPVDDYTRRPKSDYPYNSRDHLARDDKDPYARESRDPYVRESRDPYVRESKDPYVRESRDPYVREGRDSYMRADRDSYAREGREPYARDSRDPHEREGRDLYSREDRDRRPRDDLDRRERRSPGRSSSSLDRYREADRLSAERLYSTLEKRDSHTKVPLRIPSPPPAILLPPAKKPALELPTSIPVDVNASLAGGPAAALLMKLSQCSIKNENDAELASSVINLLLRSLKGYHHKLGEKNVADLMEQAEIKLGTAKAIRIVKKATPSPQLDAVAIALETLRRSSAEIPAFASLI